MRVWSSHDRGGRKCGRRAVYDDLEEGTVYTDNRARLSKTLSILLLVAWKRLYLPSSALPLTSAKIVTNSEISSLGVWSSDSALCSRADTRVDLPDEGWPSTIICYEGKEQEEETESRIEDQGWWSLNNAGFVTLRIVTSPFHLRTWKYLHLQDQRWV